MVRGIRIASYNVDSTDCVHGVIVLSTMTRASGSGGSGVRSDGRVRGGMVVFVGVVLVAEGVEQHLLIGLFHAF